MADDKVIPGLGSFTDHVAVSPGFDAAKTKVSPDEAAVIAVIGRARQIGEVVSGSGLEANAAIVALLGLRARGVVVKAKVTKTKEVEINTALLEEVDLDAARKVEVLELEKKLETASLFEILGVPRGADAAAVKAAFFELSRRFHPDRFFGKNLGSYKSRLERIFKRLSDAHQTLTNEDKRAAYLASNPSLARPKPAAPSPKAEEPPPPPPDPRRGEERRERLKKHPYLARHARVSELVQRAKASIAKGDYASAHTDLATALQADERNAEVKAMVGEVKKKADAQRAAAEYEKAVKLEQAGELQAALTGYRAASNTDPKNADAAYAVARLMFRFNLDPKETTTFAMRAVEGNPRHVEAHLLLGKLYDQADLKQMSKRHYEQVLRFAPNNAEAKKAIKGRWPF